MPIIPKLLPSKCKKKEGTHTYNFRLRFKTAAEAESLRSTYTFSTSLVNWPSSACETGTAVE